MAAEIPWSYLEFCVLVVGWLADGSLIHGVPIKVINARRAQINAITPPTTIHLIETPKRDFLLLY